MDDYIKSKDTDDLLYKETNGLLNKKIPGLIYRDKLVNYEL